MEQEAVLRCHAINRIIGTLYEHGLGSLILLSVESIERIIDHYKELKH
jgi:hypothetical protein